MAIADVIRKRIRTNDVFARWGGEEFVILMAGAALDVAVSKAEAIREAIARLEFKEIGPVSCSFGVAQLQRRAPEAGRIRLGIKTGRAMKSLDTFRFTSPHRDAIEELDWSMGVMLDAGDRLAMTARDLAGIVEPAADQVAAQAQ